MAISTLFKNSLCLNCPKVSKYSLKMCLTKKSLNLKRSLTMAKIRAPNALPNPLPRLDVRTRAGRILRSASKQSARSEIAAFHCRSSFDIPIRKIRLNKYWLKSYFSIRHCQKSAWSHVAVSIRGHSSLNQKPSKNYYSIKIVQIGNTNRKEGTQALQSHAIIWIYKQLCEIIR